jgi:predicted NBD/HSP70 family sugar kinase
VFDAAAELTEHLLEESGLPAPHVRSAVVGVPGVVDPATGRISLAENAHGLDGLRVGAELERELGVVVDIENDVNLAALGERWRGVARDRDDFAFLSIGTGLGAGWCCAASCTAATTAPPARWTTRSARASSANRPCAAALVAFVARAGVDGGTATALSEPFAVPDVFAAARDGDALARAAVAEEARRIALHIAPIAACRDIGPGDHRRRHRRERRPAARGRCAPSSGSGCPYPPRVEVSGLGDAAVLSGALAVGPRDALEAVFVNRHGIALA